MTSSARFARYGYELGKAIRLVLGDGIVCLMEGKNLKEDRTPNSLKIQSAIKLNGLR